MSANINIGRTMPVDALAGKTSAIKGMNNTLRPAIPVFVNPMEKAVMIAIDHWSQFSSGIILAIAKDDYSLPISPNLDFLYPPFPNNEGLRSEKSH